MTVFHNSCCDYHEITARPLDCARSGYLHTICAGVTKEKISSLRTQTAVSTILGHAFTQTGPDRAAVSPTTLAALAPASHTSSTSVCRFHACKLHQFHQRLQVSRLQVAPAPSGFHAVVQILDILHAVRARFIWRLHAAFLSVSFC